MPDDNPDIPGPLPPTKIDTVQPGTPVSEVARQIRGLLKGHVEHGSYVSFIGWMRTIPRVQYLKLTEGKDFVKTAHESGVQKAIAYAIVQFNLVEKLPEIWAKVEAEAGQAKDRGQPYTYPAISKVIGWYKPPKTPTVNDDEVDGDGRNRPSKEIERDLQETTDALVQSKDALAALQQQLQEALADAERARNAMRSERVLREETEEKLATATARLAEIDAVKQAEFDREAREDADNRYLNQERRKRDHIAELLDAAIANGGDDRAADLRLELAAANSEICDLWVQEPEPPFVRGVSPPPVTQSEPVLAVETDADAEQATQAKQQVAAPRRKRKPPKDAIMKKLREKSAAVARKEKPDAGGQIETETAVSGARGSDEQGRSTDGPDDEADVGA